MFSANISLICYFASTIQGNSSVIGKLARLALPKG